MLHLLSLVFSLPLSLSLSLSVLPSFHKITRAYFPPRNLTSVERQSLRLEEGSTGACLFAVARLQQFGDGVGPQLSMQTNENEFVSRVGVDGRFTYVDPR